MTIKKSLITTGAAALSFLGSASMAFADVQIRPCPTGSNFNNLCSINEQSVPSIVSGVVIILLTAAVLIALFFLIWGGIRWVTSGGDKAKVETARNTIIAAIIGLIIAFLAYFILTIVGKFFNIDIFNLAIPQIHA